MNKKMIRWTFSVVISFGILLAVSLFSLSIGSSGMFLRDILPLIIDGRGSTEYRILFDIRLPRIILGFAIGGALSVAGVILQGMFRNPLVDPYTLGISGGAALGICMGIIMRFNIALGSLSLPLAGFSGAILIILLVYFLSQRKGILHIQGLLLTGVMISFISSSLIMLIMAVSHTENLQGIIFWIMGSLEEPNWTLIKVAAIVSVSGLIVSYIFSFDLNALSLGEDEAQHLGVNIEKVKRLLFVLASLLTGVCVSVSGVIGFVGLVVPHLSRFFVGSDHRILLVISFLFGASFLILCDTLARTIISPLELPVGVITGILGGSIFIYVLARRQHGGDSA